MTSATASDRRGVGGGGASGPPGPSPALAGTAVLLVGPVSPRLVSLRAWLEEERCGVRVAPGVRGALQPGPAGRPEVVVVDLGSAAPAAVAGLRAGGDAAILALGVGRGSALEAVLDAGADDYLVVPLRRTEVVARLRAALRRKAAEEVAAATVATRDFELDLGARRAVAGGRPVHLTPTEWRMVEVLVRRPGALVARGELVRMIWGSVDRPRTHSLRVHLNAVRAKLEPDPHRPRYFVTETGAGLRFVGAG
jgi:two-component system KDP operon response regulator KdpE